MITYKTGTDVINSGLENIKQQWLNIPVNQCI
jgi:hypothetical protein